jgi:hypothetical protein
MGRLDHALADQVSGRRKVLTDEGETAVAALRPLGMINVERDHRDTGFRGVANALVERVVVPDDGRDAVDLVGYRSLDDVVFRGLIIVRVLDVEIDIQLLGRVVGALQQGIKEIHARRRIDDHRDARLVGGGLRNPAEEPGERQRSEYGFHA